jgi:hypothetical protein
VSDSTKARFSTIHRNARDTAARTQVANCSVERFTICCYNVSAISSQQGDETRGKFRCQLPANRSQRVRRMEISMQPTTSRVRGDWPIFAARPAVWLLCIDSPQMFKSRCAEFWTSDSFSRKKPHLLAMNIGHLFRHQRGPRPKFRPIRTEFCPTAGSKFKQFCLHPDAATVRQKTTSAERMGRNWPNNAPREKRKNFSGAKVDGLISKPSHRSTCPRCNSLPSADRSAKPCVGDLHFYARRRETAATLEDAQNPQGDF